MQIVIGVSNYDVKWIANGYHIPDEINGKIAEAIINGKPLPERHGRLTDADALYDSTKLCHTEEDGTACVKWREINDAPTIIEGSESE